MDAARILLELCQRYRVSPDFGLRMRPLVERAGQASPEVRERIMALVRRSFREEARRRVVERERLGRLGPADRRLLSTVAGVLHTWKPPGWLQRWSEPDGAD